MTEQHTRIPTRGRGGTLIVVRVTPRLVLTSVHMGALESMTLGSEMERGQVKIRRLGDGVVEIEHPEGTQVEILDTKSWG